MGTNFYLRVIPTQKKKDALKKAINNNAFGEIEELTEEMYGSLDSYYIEGNPKFGYMHLGKRSGGWRFLWNPQIYRKWIEPHFEYYTLYDLTAEGITKFLKSFDNAYITSEYGLYDPSLDANEGMMSVDEFMDMALNWGKEYTFDTQYNDMTETTKRSNLEYHGLPKETLNMLQNKYGDIKEGYAGDFWIGDLRFSTSNNFG